ncbi:MAG TPA: signal peptidase II [Caulobacteraceae bacterium]|jgi:signal peptidase II|nr:signal peptidase II [Caulobacteraceae bacterium]
MSEQTQPSPLKQVTPNGWLAYGLAAAVIVVDQASKFWILQVVDLPARGQVLVAPFFNLSMVWNRGVSFGLLRAEADLARWGLAAFALVVAVALVVWARRAERVLTGLALGLIIGGALGNVIDRIRFGAVTDFLDFTGLGFPWVFNVADSGVSVGVALVLLESVIGQRKA